MLSISKTLTASLMQASKFYASAATTATEAENISFLKMVESYFDKAGKHTTIRPDKLNFYKKPDNVVKFTLTLTRGISLNYAR